MYDNICKFIADEFPLDIATWLLGEPINLVTLSPKELSLEPIRTDALILKQSEEVILHAEFQTNPKPDIPFRMADYRLRGYRRYPQKKMIQVVVYLRKSSSNLVYQDEFKLENTTHRFNLIRLWEQPAETFLQSNGLLPFAVLTQAEDKTSILREVACLCDRIGDSTVRSNISASTSILAGLVLKEDDINQILRSDIMKESVIYQQIRREAIAEGKQEGRQEGVEIGIQQATTQIARNLLRSEMNMEKIAELTGLSLEKIQELAQELNNSDLL